MSREWKQVDAVRGESSTEGDFFQIRGLKAPPQFIRLEQERIAWDLEVSLWHSSLARE